MKILLVTGLLAEELVKNYIKDSSLDIEVLALKVPVAAFLTPKIIADALKEREIKSFDMIFTPGLIRGDTEIIHEVTGIAAFKGPRYAADLPIMIEAIKEVKFSTTIPACELLIERLQKKALEEIEKVEQNQTILLEKPGNFRIKNLAIGKEFPMRIMAEIVDAALMETIEVQRLAIEFVQAGANIIDIGMVAGENRPEDAKRLVEAVKKVISVPVSIDTLNPEEIKAAISAGVDIIMSADAGNIEKIAPYAQNCTVIVIPTNQSQGYFPKKAQERVQTLEQIISAARNLGITKILGDLILEPTNILESFIAYKQFAERNPEVPIFIGVSNVTELFDADSIGINALLANLSSEINASILLATEKSDKAKGTVKEEVIAAKMMFLAKKRSSVPKDLGINLLVLKDKRNREEKYNQEQEKDAKIIIAAEKIEPTILDEKNSFRITLDRPKKTIVATHYISTKMDKPTTIIKGKTAEDIFSEIIKRNLIAQNDHAGYLGKELMKAEIALKIGKEYIQDKDIF
ncbi:MAG: dihydropteroate synthase-like protein [Crenarchaeota archaeon]|nr:dihydropteroate synthase-like protein [Thermoproteota archaeon]